MSACSRNAPEEDIPPDLEELVHKARKSSGLVQDRNKTFNTIRKSFIGHELISWMIKEGIATDRDSAKKKVKGLMANNMVSHVDKKSDFSDGNSLYRFSRDDGPPAFEMLNCAAKTGYLLKKGRVKFNERFFVLDDKEKKLLYYDNEKSNSPRNVIDLTTGTVNVTECAECKTGSYCFNLVDAHGTHVLCATKSKDQEEWMDAITKAGASFVEEEISVQGQSIFDFTVKDIAGKDVSLDQYRGMVCLIVNVASF